MSSEAASHVRRASGARPWSEATRALSGVALGSFVWLLPCVLFASAVVPGARGSPAEILAHALGYFLFTGSGPLGAPAVFCLAVTVPAVASYWALIGTLAYLGLAGGWTAAVITVPDLRRLPWAIHATLATAWHLAGACGGFGLLLFGGYALSTM